MNKLILLLTILSYSSTLLSQELPEKQIKKALKGKEITQLENNIFSLRVKKTKKVGIFEWDNSKNEASTLVPAYYDSIGWFTEDIPFLLAKEDQKYCIVHNPYEGNLAEEKSECLYQEIKTTLKNEELFVCAKLEGKWGLIYWFDNSIIMPFIYDSFSDVPLVKMQDWQIQEANKARYHLGADLVMFDKGNGDGVFKARNSTTKKWGMYQGYKNVLIPMEFDSLEFIPYNGKYSAVYKNGKVGFQLSKWSYDETTQTIPCLYDAFQRFTYKNRDYLAVSLNGKWGWINWLSGELESELKYDEAKFLPPPTFEQKKDQY